MKKIQNAKILTNQQMKHISGGSRWQSGHGVNNGSGNTCPVNASKDDCKGKCDYLTILVAAPVEYMY